MFLSTCNKKLLFCWILWSLIIILTSPAFCLTPDEITEDLFPDDGSELAYTARRVLNAYEDASSIDPDSVATLNNLGVLYLLLEDYDNAETYFDLALDISINDLNGSAGIIMNQGVLNSDLNLPEEAEQLYIDASSMVTDDIDSSVLMSQLNYNQAWDAFDSDNYEDAIDFVNATLNNENTGSLLRAKSLALRGATYYQQGNNELAELDLLQAITTDPYGVEGPIVLLAAENLRDHLINTTKHLVTEIYVATFGRAPANNGLNYWGDAVDSGAFTIEQVARSFFDQLETKAKYPEGSSNTDFITTIYYNVLSRAPAVSGLAYWVDALDTDLMRRDEAIMAIINGAKAETGSSEDAAMLAKKAAIGVLFAYSEIGTDFSTNENFMDWATNIIGFAASDDFNVEEAVDYIAEILLSD